jgi:hypothetical protein
VAATQKFLEIGKGSAMEFKQAQYGVKALEAPSRQSPARNSQTMKKILLGLCAFSLCAGLVPKISAQTVTITVGPGTDDSSWVWNDEYQVWVWNGPEFQGDYEGHPYSYWHGRHEAGGDRHHRPGKGDSGESKQPVNKANVEQSKGIQPRVEFDRSKEAPPQAEIEKPNVQPLKPAVDMPKAEEKARSEKPQTEEKSKTEKPNL